MEEQDQMEAPGTQGVALGASTRIATARFCFFGLGASLAPALGGREALGGKAALGGRATLGGTESGGVGAALAGELEACVLGAATGMQSAATGKAELWAPVHAEGSGS